ncbi:hypothetical protein EDC04DRAFT_1478676 [Pisolithus marmoratus]|nr:hypothetical protein EDC04DRAFT_1478676 [Pisolithus marmoratus]
MRSVLHALTRVHHQLLLPYPQCTRRILISTLHSLNRSYATSPKHLDNRKPTNDKIPYAFVRVVDPETNKLSPTKQSLQTLISSLDLKKWIVELVAEKPEPIVRIVDRKEAFQKYKEQRKAMKKGTKSGEAAKEIQLTWATASGDISHKLAKARSYLEKGCKVEIVFARKKGQPLPTPKEMQGRLQDVASELMDVSKDWKVREVSSTMKVISFQGTCDSG